MDNDKEFDSFDDLFEPFELDEGPPPPEPPGARLTKEPLPIAPAPMGRASPGAKALGVLVGVVLVVLLLAGLRSIWRSGSGEASDTTTSSTTSSTTAIATVQLVPTSVEASSTLPGYPASNLIDGDPATEWQDQSLGGEGAVLTFRFAQPVAISYIEIQGITGDADRFRQNYRMKGYEITVDDNQLKTTNTVADDPGPHRIEIASQETNRLELSILSAYASEPVEDQLPFKELVIAEISFFGHTADE